jgi:hypothetical protein
VAWSGWRASGCGRAVSNEAQVDVRSRRIERTAPVTTSADAARNGADTLGGSVFASSMKCRIDVKEIADVLVEMVDMDGIMSLGFGTMEA